MHHTGFRKKAYMLTWVQVESSQLVYRAQVEINIVGFWQKVTWGLHNGLHKV